MPGKDYKILLIDDDEDDYIELREVVAEISRSKYELVWKSSYDEGLETLLAGSFDACILDFRLGQRTGLEFLAAAQAGGSKCPIIVLTGYGDLEIDLKSMEAGASDYLVKGQITSQMLERSIRYSVKNAHDLREIEDERENFQTLFNSTFEGIIVQTQGRIIAANRAACDIFKCTHGALIEKDLVSFLNGHFRDEVNRLLLSGRDINTEAIGTGSDGQDVFLGITSRTVNFQGSWASLIAIRDLTERKLMEAQILQQDRLASMGLLASSLAHEIGTPLGVIRGRAEQVQKHADEKTKATMTLIVSQIDRIAKLVKSLLNIGRSSGSGLTADVNLGLVLDDVLALMSHELERNNIALKLDVSEGLIVQAEAGPLGQVFLNLLVNAIHAITSKPEAAQRSIEVIATEADQTVQVAIADSGTGIKDQDLARLFQPFFTTKNIGEGTGLGLATSYNLVSTWGGSIQVQTKLGAGSTFTVILRK